MKDTTQICMKDTAQKMYPQRVYVGTWDHMRTELSFIACFQDAHVCHTCPSIKRRRIFVRDMKQLNSVQDKKCCCKEV